MSKFKDASIYFISIIIVVILMYFDFFRPSNTHKLDLNGRDVLQIIIAYIGLAYLIYMIIVGRIVTKKKTIFRNILVLLLGNILIYSFIFILNPTTKIEDIFTNDAMIFFNSYFIFSVLASFIGSKIFYDYQQEIIKNGYHRYVFWKFNLQAIISNLMLYFVCVQLVNPLLKYEVFYNQIGNYILVGIISIIFLSIFHYLDRKRNSYEKEIIQQLTKAETATANFETLKNQLDPHFLFNSLNVLTGLIEENPEKAVDFTTSLSKIYRYLLEQKDKEVVPLEDEIKFAKTYINLLKLRFEDSIHFHLNLIDFNENDFIVPLSLQILLENTIKHNIVSENKPLKIRIYKDNQQLIVENSFQPKETIKDSTGVGLNNIKNRYQLISNREVEIQQTEEKFSVALPILTQKINVTKENNLAYEQVKDKVEALKKFYKNLIFYLFTLIFSYFMFNNFKYWIISLIFIILFVIKEWIKVSGIEENWEKQKAQKILNKNNQTKKWN